LAQDFDRTDALDFDADTNPFDHTLFAEDEPRSPSLPIILFSAACGISSGIIALYVAYRLILLSLPWSAGVATLVMLGVLSLTSAGLSSLTRSHLLANTAFSCGLLLLALFFFGLCSFVGALAATLLLTLQPT
jgi:hypothetical protein